MFLNLLQKLQGRPTLRRSGRKAALSARAQLLSVFILSGVLILALETMEVRWWRPVSQRIMESALWTSRVLRAPFDEIYDILSDVEGYVSLREKVDILRRENAVLRQAVAHAQRLRHENNLLHSYLHTFPHLPLERRLVPVVAWPGGVFVHTLLIGAGHCDGVYKGQPVLGRHALLGRVIQTGCHAARILLLTDVNAHTPVAREGEEVYGILTGLGDGTAVVRHLNGNLQPGDHLVTSAYGGIFPAGLPVGTVTHLEEGVPHVHLDEDTSAGPSYVQLLDYTPAQLPAELPA